MHRGRLVAHVNDVQSGVERGVEDRHHVVARKREHVPHAGRGQRPGEHVGASHQSLSSRSACSRSFDFCTLPLAVMPIASKSATIFR